MPVWPITSPVKYHTLYGNLVLCTLHKIGRNIFDQKFFQLIGKDLLFASLLWSYWMWLPKLGLLIHIFTKMSRIIKYICVLKRDLSASSYLKRTLRLVWQKRLNLFRNIVFSTDLKALFTSAYMGAMAVYVVVSIVKIVIHDIAKAGKKSVVKKKRKNSGSISDLWKTPDNQIIDCRISRPCYFQSKVFQ